MDWSQSEEPNVCDLRANTQINNEDAMDTTQRGHAATDHQDAAKSSSLGRMDTFKLPDEEGDSSKDCAPPSLLDRCCSVDRDARHIVALLNTDNFDVIYKRVKELRDMANRAEIVTNEVLERIDPSSISRDAGAVKLAVFETYPGEDLNNDRICSLLEDHLYEPDRMAVVQNIILKELELKQKSLSKDKELGEGDILNFLKNEHALVSDLESIIAQHPSVDPHEAFKLLITKFINSDHRVTDVVTYLAGDMAAVDKRGDSNLTREGLLRDTDVIAAVFPGKDRNEIYAYLEAHYHTANRVQVVMEELLRLTRDQRENNPPRQNLSQSLSQKSTTTRLTSQSSKSFKRGKKQAKHEGQRWKKMKQISEPFPEIQRETEVELLRAIFPDCDPDFLFTKLETMVDDPDRVHRLSEELFETTDYPKLQDRLRREQRARRLNQLLNQELDLNYFLVLFQDPEDFYADQTREVSESYKQHALIQLQNDFPLLSLEYIRKIFNNKNQGTYYPTKAEIEDLFDEISHSPSGDAVAKREELSEHILPEPRKPLDYPEALNDYFFKELLFVKNRDAIKGHVKKINEEKEEKEGERLECIVCYDTDFLEEDMIGCDNEDESHKFCLRCVHKHVLQGMSQAMLQFMCMLEDCSSIYPLDVAKRVLSSSEFSLLLRRMQEDEIRRAAIKDLVSCPFCSFATIMSDPNDRVFKCLNPDCFRESCRLCREPSHVPLRCEEVRRLGETNMKSYIEKRMTESMLRICWRCKKRFFKTEGCNRMQCPCGASMCYLCKCPLRDYDHYEGYGDDVPGKCQLYGEAINLHWQEMKKAALEAKREWVKLHSEDAEKAKAYSPFEITKSSKQREFDDADTNDTNEATATTSVDNNEAVPGGSEEGASTEPATDQNQTTTGTDGDQSQATTGTEGDQNQATTGTEGDQNQATTGIEGDQNQTPTGPEGDQNQTPTGPEGDQNQTPTGPEGDQNQTPTGPEGGQNQATTEGDQNQAMTGTEGDQNQTPTGLEVDQNQTPTGTEGVQNMATLGTEGDQNQTPTGLEVDQNQTPTGTEGDQNQATTGAEGDHNQATTSTEENQNQATTMTAPDEERMKTDTPLDREEVKDGNEDDKEQMKASTRENKQDQSSPEQDQQPSNIETAPDHEPPELEHVVDEEQTTAGTAGDQAEHDEDENNPLVAYYDELGEEDIDELEEGESISDGEFEQAMEEWRKSTC